MANPAPVTYEIRLKDLMTKTLKKMGVSVKQLQTRLRKGLANALKVARMALKGFTVAAGAAAAAAAAVGFAAVRAGRSFIEAASRAEETRSKFSAVFKEQTADANEMAQAMADELGRNSTEIQGFMARLQDTFVPMGIARDQAMDMSGAITQLAFDLTSFNPELGSTQEAIDALSSAMIGNHETVKRFGVIINEAALNNELFEMGARKVNGAFTEQDKAMARLRIILRSTTDAQGDLIRTQDSWFNSTQELESRIEKLREAMGDRLIAKLQETMANMGGVDAIVDHVALVFEFLTKILTDIVIPTVANVMENFSKFVIAMGGVDEAVVAVGEGVLLMGKAFQLMWNSVSLVFKLFIGGIETIIYLGEMMMKMSQLTVGVIGIALVGAFRLGVEIMGLFGKALDAVVIFIKDTAIKVFQGLINTIADLIETIGESLVALGSYDLVPSFIKDAGEAAVSAAKGMREFSASQDDLKGGATIFKTIGEELDAFGDKVQPAQDKMLEYTKKTLESMKEISVDFADQVMEDLPSMNALIESISEGATGIGTDYEALAEKVNQALSEIDRVEIATPEQRDLLADMTSFLERYAKAVETAKNEEQELANSTVTLKDRFDQLGDAATRFATEKIPDMEESMGRIAEGAISSFANGMTDALMSIVDGSASAGEAFKKFASQFLMDIARMIIQTLVFNAIRSAMGLPLANGGVVAGGLGEMTAFANGGVASGGLGRFMPVKGYATGGPIVNKPHVALIGEGQHNEAVVPLPDGRSIPVDMTGAPETQVSINIEAVDGASVDRMLFDRRDTLRSIISTAIAESRSFRGAVARA